MCASWPFTPWWPVGSSITLVQFLAGHTASLGFVSMISDPGVNVLYMAIVVFVGFFVLSFNLQGGLERVTKYMMVALLLLMVVLAVRRRHPPRRRRRSHLLPDAGSHQDHRFHRGGLP